MRYWPWVKPGRAGRDLSEISESSPLFRGILRSPGGRRVRAVPVADAGAVPRRRRSVHTHEVSSGRADRCAAFLIVGPGWRVPIGWGGLRGSPKTDSSSVALCPRAPEHRCHSSGRSSVSHRPTSRCLSHRHPDEIELPHRDSCSLALRTRR
jgi:hypothetical protein